MATKSHGQSSNLRREHVPDLSPFEVDAIRRWQKEEDHPGTQRADIDPVDYWKQPIEPLKFGREEFRLIAYRGKRDAPLKLDGVAVGVEWIDDNPVMKGTLTVRQGQFADFSGAAGYEDTVDPRVDRTRPKRALKKGFDLGPGHFISCMVAPYGKIVPGNLAPNNTPDKPGTDAIYHSVFRNLWGMRIVKPSTQLKDDVQTFELESDLSYLAKNKYDWRFRHMRASDVVKKVCSRYGIPVGRLAKAHERIDITKEQADGLSIIKEAYKKEEERTGRKFVIDFRGRYLEVRPLQRSRAMLILGETLLDGTYTETVKEDFATALRADVSIKGGDKFKLEVESKEMSARYGFISGDVSDKIEAVSRADARKQIVRMLKTQAEPNKELEITHPGIASLRRGHALQINVPYADLATRVVFVTAITHTVNPGDYQMTVTLRFDDPYRDLDLLAARAKICEVAKHRGRSEPAFCKGSGPDIPDDPLALPDNASDQSKQRADDTSTPAPTDPTAPAGGGSTP